MKLPDVITSYVYVLVLTGAHVNPIDGREVAGSHSSLSEGPLDTFSRITKRETTPEGLEGSTFDQCEVVSLPKGSGEEHLGQFVERRFFFQPGPNFKRMVFRIRLENTLTGNPSFQVSHGLTFDANELVNSTSNSTGGGPPGNDWFLVQVEDFKFVRKWGRDRNALRVSIKGLTKELIVKHWWTVNRYSGFDLYAKGKSFWTFDCDPRNHCPERLQLALEGAPPEVSHAWCWTIIGALLLVVAVVIGLLLFAVRGPSALKSSPRQWSLGKDSVTDITPPKPTDEEQQKAKNLYVAGPVRPYQGNPGPGPVDDEHLYAEISEASFVAWSAQMSEKYLQSVSLESKVAAE